MKKIFSNTIMSKGIMVLFFFSIVIFSWVATTLFIGSIFIYTSLASLFSYGNAIFGKHTKQLLTDKQKTTYYSKTIYQTLRNFHLVTSSSNKAIK